MVAFCTFLLARLAPGDFLSELSANPQVSAETIEAMRRQYGADRPWYLQFFNWLVGAVQWDFGYSPVCNCPVGDLIAERMINTVTLATAGLAIALAVALPLGVISSYPGLRMLDRILSILFSVNLSMPSFLLALGAMVLAAGTGWFPIGGVSSFDYQSLSPSGKIADFLHHLILPAAVLGIRQIPAYFRQMRAGMSESLAQDYIIVARAKGLPERRIYFRHALRNAINPVITMVGNSIGSILSGAFIVETIMSWPGLGSLSVASLLGRDLNSLIACLFLVASLLALGNLISDILQALADPRIKHSSIL